MKNRIFMLGVCSGLLAGLCTAPLVSAVFRPAAAETKAENPYAPLTCEIRGESVCITGCDSDAAGAVAIPAEIGGLPVTEIAESAFLGCNHLESVSIPESVTKIGAFAFRGCSGLQQIDLNCRITELPERVFAGCSSLQRVPIPEGVETIGECAFGECSRLRSLIFPESVSVIEDMALNGCASLDYVTVLNPECRIVCLAFYYDNLDIRGYAGSTAETYVRYNNNYTFCPLAPEGSVFCDADGDGEITVGDAQCVLQYYTETLAQKTPSWHAITGNPDIP